MEWNRRAKGAAVAAVVLVVGGVTWGVVGQPEDPLRGSCRGSLAVDEASGFYGGAELESRGHTAEWVGQEVEYCSVWARDEEDGAVLRLQIRPSAAHRAAGAADEAAAAPVGYGWNGSFIVRGRPEAAVLVDCAPLAGKGLLVLAEATEDAEELSRAQVLGVARLATETARRAAERFGCEGTLGRRPDTVDTTRATERPAAEARETCRGVVGPRSAEVLGIATVHEYPAGALTEECDVHLRDHRMRVNAYYGPSAMQETYLDKRYPGSVDGIVTRSRTCPGALGAAYFKATPPQLPDGSPAPLTGPEREAVNQILASFAEASGDRHGCAEG
ncbi:hypothetical protein [Streptomyces zhihengii]|uniref:Uncharacterized protein n=1 Tax=Streptomyces zhihengii TaxID=1818004 RepID=A0ABS2UNE1_9ACTN|nr:hypothetical protein [Streptomyces zhihengii]MBM9618878.1 hypothetical protein [Streptomyces zhihengii]